MFAFLHRRRIAKLERRYLALLQAARDLQRGGDIRGFAQKTDEAEQLRQQLEQLRAALAG